MTSLEGRRGSIRSGRWLLLPYPRVARQRFPRLGWAFWSADPRRSSRRTILWKYRCRSVEQNWSFPLRCPLEKDEIHPSSLHSTHQWRPPWTDGEVQNSSRHSREERWKSERIRRLREGLPAMPDEHHQVVDVVPNLRCWIITSERETKVQSVRGPYLEFRWDNSRPLSSSSGSLSSLRRSSSLIDSSIAVLTSMGNRNNWTARILEFAERRDRPLSIERTFFNNLPSGDLPEGWDADHVRRVIVYWSIWAQNQIGLLVSLSLSMPSCLLQLSQFFDESLVFDGEILGEIQSVSKDPCNGSGREREIVAYFARSRFSFFVCICSWEM